MEKQNGVMVLTNLEQLKSLSDPLRIEILCLLVEEARSGQQLSQQMGESRSKIHYHLQDLEKNGLIRLVEENRKGNMTQKLYRAVAKSYIPSTELLSFHNEYGESRRLMTLSTLDRAKSRALAAPESAFLTDSEDHRKWHRIASQTEVNIPKEKFKKWVAKYHDLIQELNRMAEEEVSEEEMETFYLMTVAFQIDEPYFKGEKEDE
ncbi:helix-turn-helix domain-containing protein [Paenibacillus chitinolyticus]|uniref:ArsR/SmtB family transcription factor n=1 Tax=Paenibacillus chitinolyticus TaxID=79263 RepID=UPI002DBF4B6E|nr:helix-turn-helix domain-containing protein [Paenibacillus chitinolyticus]MEC0244945.1 helix-turn-helix domain-containing protein [Paenibacillus chitinolyticus]